MSNITKNSTDSNIKSSKLFQLDIKDTESLKREKFENLWFAASNNKIDNNGNLLIGDEGVRLYSPFREERLLDDFANIYKSVNINDSITKFINKYGMLGRDLLSLNSDNYQKENIDWFFAHCKTVNICMKIINMLKKFEGIFKIRSSTDSILNIYLKSINENDNDLANSTMFKDIAFGYEIMSSVRICTYNCTSDYEKGIKIISELINPNIIGIRRELRFYDGELENVFTYTALIEVIYWLLANAASKGNVAECEWCHRLFVQTHHREKYCPKEGKFETESKCSQQAKGSRRKNKKIL